MSRYTTELRFICEQYAGKDESVGYGNVDEVIEGSRSKIFDFTYPIFDEEYREELEKKIILHFYTREICEETVGLWKLRLRDKMNMIMPLYNQYYLSALIDFDPMKNIDEEIDENFDKKRGEDFTRTDNLIRTDNLDEHMTGKSESHTKATDEEHKGLWDLYSDTPQGSIDRIDVEENAYLTSARHTFGDGNQDIAESWSDTHPDTHKKNTGTVTNGGNQRREGISHTEYGNIKKIFGMDMTKLGSTPSRLLKEFRETFLNIDAMVMDELEELFMQLW